MPYHPRSSSTPSGGNRSNRRNMRTQQRPQSNQRMNRQQRTPSTPTKCPDGMHMMPDGNCMPNDDPSMRTRQTRPTRAMNRNVSATRSTRAMNRGGMNTRNEMNTRVIPPRNRGNAGRQTSSKYYMNGNPYTGHVVFLNDIPYSSMGGGVEGSRVRLTGKNGLH